jgi:hypothetical protein
MTFIESEVSDPLQIGDWQRPILRRQLRIRSRGVHPDGITDLVLHFISTAYDVDKV